MNGNSLARFLIFGSLSSLLLGCSGGDQDTSSRLAGVPSPSASAISSIEVVADGLDNPRGLAFGPNGDLFVAEAGRGGAGPCIEGGEGEVCFGASGAVTRIRNGVQKRIVTGLPSFAAPDGSGAGGPHGISVHGMGNIDLAVGLGANPAARDNLPSPGNVFGHLLKIRPDGTWSTVADVSGHEAAENPDGGEVDSNPFGIVSGPGERVVADAGANALLRVASGGRVSTLAVFPDRMVQNPFAPPGVMMPMQSVPTSVIRHGNGYYVGELTGFPFEPGSARVYHVTPGNPPEVFAEGFTNIIGIAEAGGNALYVLEIATHSLLSEDPTGALWRLNPGGSRDLLTTELILPGGVTVGPDGAVYVTDCSVCPGGGRVLRITP